MDPCSGPCSSRRPQVSQARQDLLCLHLGFRVWGLGLCPRTLRYLGDYKVTMAVRLRDYMRLRQSVMGLRSSGIVAETSSGFP